jgi:threonine/homoserine/homoserine lactone efflux protein
VFGTHDLALFALTVLILNATPGVDMALTLVATLRGGIGAGLAAAAGVSVGCIAHALAATFGLAALMTASSAAFQAVKWAGAAYLLWLALGMLRNGLRKTAAAASQADSPAETARAAATWFRQGLLTNVLNPKVALFFLALLPQFIDTHAAHKTQAFVFLGAWAITQGALFLAAFVLLVAPLRRQRPRPALVRALHLAGGGLFVGLAARLAQAERP